MQKPARVLRLGLLWHSLTSDNLGVGALTVAHIALLEAAAQRVGVEVEFVILGWKDRRAPYRKGANVEIVELRMKDFFKPVGGLYSRLRGCDLVFDISAGDSFTDIYGTKRMATVTGAKRLTLLARRDLILAPQTIGPFDKGWARRAAFSVMRGAAVVATRDDLSIDFLRGLAYDGPLIAASDVALRLPCDPVERAPGGPVKVGLNVSGLLFNGGYTRGNMFELREGYADLIRALLTRLTARPDHEVHLVPHVISDDFEVEDDYRVSQTLAAEFPAVRVAPKFADPVEAKTYIAGLDFFAGARMHACIAAFSTGVPVLPMAYSRKFAGLFGALGYDLLADCREDDNARILEIFDDALDRREEIATQARLSLAVGLERLAQYEEAVEDRMRAALSHAP